MINIATFNCHSVRKNIEKVIDLLRNNDILLLQELMLYLEDAEYIKNIDDNFECCFMLQKMHENMIIGGRPSKGVAILWRKSLDKLIRPLKIDERLVGITLSSEDKGKILILNVYMPFDAHNIDSLHDYRTYIAKLQSLIDCNDFDNIIIAGDINADPSKGRFWKEIELFLSLNDIYHKSSEFKKEDFTYLCPASSSTSFIDHVFCSQNIKDRIINSHILYNFSLFDHFPINFTLDIKLDFSDSYFLKEENKTFIDWNKVKDNEIRDFKSNIAKLIIDNEEKLENLTKCNKENCVNRSCYDNLDSLFELIIFILITSCSFLVRNSKRKYKQVAGWSEYVKAAYNNAHDCFIHWKNEGKPLKCLSHTKMIDSRKLFRNKF